MCNHGAADIIGIGRSYKTRCRESEFRDSNGSDMVAAEKKFTENSGDIRRGVSHRS